MGWIWQYIMRAMYCPHNQFRINILTFHMILLYTRFNLRHRIITFFIVFERSLMSRYPFTKNTLRHMYCTHLSYVNFFITLKCQNSHVIKHKWWVDQLHYRTYLWIWVYIHGCILFSCHAGTNKHFIYYSETYQYRKNRRLGWC